MPEADLDDNLKKFQAATTAAVVTRCITHPFDTIKTRVHYSTGKAGSISSSLHGLKGFASLYNGLPVSLLFSIPAVSLYLLTYDMSKEAMTSRWLSYYDAYHVPIGAAALVHGASAGFAEAVSGLFWTPMEILKGKQQASACNKQQPVSLSTRRLISHIYQQEGLRGFFRGYWLSLAVFLPQTIIYFITYERLKLIASRHYYPKQSSPKQKLPVHYYTVCAGLSGALAGAISNITDIVKTRIQVGTSLSTINLMRHMYQKEGGLKAFTRGMWARVLYVMPSVCISFTIYEALK